MPIEISFGDSSVRDKMSETVINKAPVNNVAPSSTLKFGPTSRRAK